MKNWLAIAAALALTVIPATSQSSQMPRLKGTAHPNLDGLWQSITEANWDIQAHAAQPGRRSSGRFSPSPPGRVSSRETRYLTSPGRSPRKRITMKSVSCASTSDGVRLEPLDPEAKCYMPGEPRATYMPFPFQIIQGDKKISSPMSSPAPAASSNSTSPTIAPRIAIWGGRGPVGGRHAGGGREPLQRQNVVRPRRQFP